MMRVVLSINGQDYSTIDVPEAIGPWIARVWGSVKPAPHSSVHVQIY